MDRPIADRITQLARLEQTEELANLLRQEHPQGLVGEREGLVTYLMQAGLSHHEAVETANRLEQAGYAHFIPAQRSRWLFLQQAQPELLKNLGPEYNEFVTPTEPSDPKEEVLDFIVERFGVDRDVAEELFSDLEASGYIEQAYDPNRERDRYRFLAWGNYPSVR
ncbi:MAG: hypothetical protein ACOYW9_14340 [Deinococcota bacterium]|uniref:hypothetical protein n=1 Tax=Allomeiothermus silvanus TaxID=52022 RepID=UPI002356AFED|nr:hypothetical protein [Allomeiothermus silvanus]MBI5812469.1 hypothetical protein [Allomeiothermus silvanus]MCL6567961.1 hypothetical protein [Allomeiothermus silvanus]